MLIFALALVTQNPGPTTPLTEIHQRDIACVAVVALAAAGNWYNPPISLEPKKVDAVFATQGKKWAGIVGDRVTAETGQPREVIGFAMTEAAKAEKELLSTTGSPERFGLYRLNECMMLMDAQLAQRAADLPLPKPLPKAQ